jgi:hypothetical protein
MDCFNKEVAEHENSLGALGSESEPIFADDAEALTVKSEDLIAMASAHGVDLLRAAKMASNAKSKPDVITKHGARVLIPPSSNRARGTETRTMERPTWTIAEIGQAAQGVPEVQFRAALFAFAGAREHLWFLHRSLMERARMFARLYKWPPWVRDFHGLKLDYIEHLCKMVLDEDSNPVYFRTTPELYAVYMTVNNTVWVKQLEPCYSELKRAWGDWLGQAARKIQSKLNEHEGE